MLAVHGVNVTSSARVMTAARGAKVASVVLSPHRPACAGTAHPRGATPSTPPSRGTAGGASEPRPLSFCPKACTKEGDE